MYDNYKHERRGKVLITYLCRPKEKKAMEALMRLVADNKNKECTKIIEEVLG
jgi:hypothetical protein